MWGTFLEQRYEIFRSKKNCVLKVGIIRKQRVGHRSVPIRSPTIVLRDSVKYFAFERKTAFNLFDFGDSPPSFVIRADRSIYRIFRSWKIARAQKVFKFTRARRVLSVCTYVAFQDFRSKQQATVVSSQELFATNWMWENKA